ncbi:MAG: LuxR family transcriptional regulator [Hoeflea sp.]|jgi:DNA-binding CsgD family transcriptional regulator|uniref:helix-turn-helix transcriptional regulator n=1 Tax=Hoeflea sp. TaxID=1940281 RepID=UPI0032EE4231
MNSQDTLFERLRSVQTEQELARFFADLARAFRFICYGILDIPAASNDRLGNQIVLTNLPAEFVSDYDALKLLRNSPTLAALKRSTAPITWDLEMLYRERPKQEVEPLKELYERHRLVMGVYFPVHGPNGRRAAVVFAGDREQLVHTEMGELGLYVLHAYDAYSNLVNREKSQSKGITARELEVLHWAAHGKTSTEIAAILSLSDHTINAYMNSAMRKLDCVNRTQMVAKALRLHLIS